MAADPEHPAAGYTAPPGSTAFEVPASPWALRVLPDAVTWVPRGQRSVALPLAAIRSYTIRLRPRPIARWVLLALGALSFGAFITGLVILELDPESPAGDEVGASGLVAFLLVMASTPTTLKWRLKMSTTRGTMRVPLYWRPASARAKLDRDLQRALAGSSAAETVAPAPFEPVDATMGATVVAPTNADAPQAFAGATRFEVAKRLGQGAFGTVELAHDSLLGRDIVLKRVHPHLAAHQRFRQNAVREARMAAKIVHPNVVTLHDAIEEGDALTLVMEFVDGPTLEEKLSRTSPMTSKAAARLGCDLAKGLAAIHAAGIIHRDLKPHNILLTRGGVPKIADLGIAKEGLSDSGLSATGLQPGTVRYMSPEQASGTIELDARSDLWSLGAIIFRAVTGASHAGPADQSETQLRQRIVKGSLDWSAARDTVPPPLVRVLRRALATDREKRYVDATRLARAFERVHDQL